MPGKKRILTDADLIALQRKEIEDLNQRVFELGDKIQTLEVELDTKHLPRIAQLEAELAETRRDGERLDWMEQNPRLVVASTGYRGSKDCWCWRDKSAALATHESNTLREAIDAARGGVK